jgi:hypothetical protein
MGQAKARRAEIAAVKRFNEFAKRDCMGFDVFFKALPDSMQETAQMISNIGRWASNEKGLGFKGGLKVSMAKPSDATHPSPCIHPNTLAVTFMWDRPTKVNAIEGLQRISYIMENLEDDFDGSEFYTVE